MNGRWLAAESRWEGTYHEPQHGTRARYRKGCRGEECGGACLRAEVEYRRRYRAKARAKATARS